MVNLNIFYFNTLESNEITKISFHNTPDKNDVNGVQDGFMI